MSDDPFHEAVEALRAIGRKVEPTGDDLGLWLVDGHECTDGDLIALARLFSLVDDPERAQLSRGDDSPSVGGRALEALRAVALYPRGMRLTAYPQAMRTLIDLGYAIERQARWDGANPGQTGWFITPAGRELLAVLGTRDHG